ncbi:SCO4226 family nickel-binding protein [Brevibacterium sp.]|uniref:SCO4226 family nickel-binding protein n=1 Tax=Brevibacterium sp. TaxID=1701 RepID=UPI0028113D1A|nr:SCO4226 family nickel-binding protein [Brevibacterium sp.]
MSKFMDVHSGMTGITTEMLAQAHSADLAIQDEEGVSFERAWADPVSGTVFCLSEAPTAEAVQRIHERTGHPADNVYEVPINV